MEHFEADDGVEEDDDRHEDHQVEHDGVDAPQNGDGRFGVQRDEEGPGQHGQAGHDHAGSQVILRRVIVPRPYHEPVVCIMT